MTMCNPCYTTSEKLDYFNELNLPNRHIKKKVRAKLKKAIRNWYIHPHV